MLFGINEQGKRIHIKDIENSSKYFCPCPSCRGLLVPKRGTVKAHHFAHSKNTVCSDSWHEDMSEWHIFWQSLFPFETQEIYKEKDGRCHRADVLIEETKTVLEFQHSPLSIEEFEDRNSFYNTLGYKVIWIFDIAELYEEKKIINYSKDLYQWKRSSKTFYRFDAKKQMNEVQLYFQIIQDASQNAALQELIKLKEDGYQLGSEDITYIYSHKNDKIGLIKITWNSSCGFDRFATDGYLYSKEDIVSRYTNKKMLEGSFLLSELFDVLPKVFSGHEEAYYGGCPISSTHVCSDNDINLLPNLTDQIYPCCKCKHCQNHTMGEGIPFICKKRFIDTGLLPSTEVRPLEQNEDGFITKIEYIQDNEVKQMCLPIYKPGQTIFDLWSDEYEVATFINTRTSRCVKVFKNPRNQLNTYGQVKGYFCYNPHSFRGKWMEIYGCNKPEWICVHNKLIDTKTYR